MNPKPKVTPPTPGVNDLATVKPHIARLWHPTKNGELTAEGIMPGARLECFWLGDCGHEWEAAPRVMTREKNGVIAGCPVCKGRQILVGFNDLASKYPEVAIDWHPTKNGELTAEKVTYGSGKKVWWKSAVCGHEWETMVAERTSHAVGCPFCLRSKILVGFNDLATEYPEIAKLWHPTKNDILPTELFAGNKKDRWWVGECGHEWEAPSARMTQNNKTGSGCPFCCGKKVLVGFNDLASHRPHLAAEWHPTKNGDLTAEDFTYGSGKSAWWLCANNHEWEERIFLRSSHAGECRHCHALRVPKPEPITQRLAKPKTDPKPKRVPKPKPAPKPKRIPKPKPEPKPKPAPKPKPPPKPKRIPKPKAPPKPKRIPASKPPKVQRFVSEYLQNAQMISEWHTIKNGVVSPVGIGLNFASSVWWICTEGHEWRQQIRRRLAGDKKNEILPCPTGAGRRFLSGFNDLGTTNPELVTEWHPTFNTDIQPSDIQAGSNRRVWWKCRLGHDWAVPPNGRMKKGSGCPTCSGRVILEGFNDLATTRPEIASEWHPIKNGDLMPTDFTQWKNLKVWWQCSRNSRHEWEAAIYSRSDGRNCPHCINYQSKTELALYKELKGFYPDAESGNRLPVKWGKSGCAHIDILLPSLRTIIEYDGWYWHDSEKAFEKDSQKTTALIAAGYKVVRVRAKPLKFLDMKDENLVQIVHGKQTAGELADMLNQHIK